MQPRYAVCQVYEGRERGSESSRGLTGRWGQNSPHPDLSGRTRHGIGYTRGMAKLSAQEQIALGELASRIRRGLGPRVIAISLFGSRARGEGREDSDLDVLVLVRELSRVDRRVVQDLAFEVGLEHGLCISPLVAEQRTWRVDSQLGRDIQRDEVSL